MNHAEQHLASYKASPMHYKITEYTLCMSVASRDCPLLFWGKKCTSPDMKDPAYINCHEYGKQLPVRGRYNETICPA